MMLSQRAFRIVTTEFGSPPNIARLCENSVTQLRRLPGLGFQTVREIEQWLVFHGKSLDKEIPSPTRPDGLVWGTVMATRKALQAAKTKARLDGLEKRRCPCCGRIRKPESK